MIQTLILSIVLANPQSLLETAESNIAANNWSEAAKDLDEYVRTAKHPSAEAMYDRGIAHYNLGAYDVAAKAFDEAMGIAHDSMLQTYSAYNLGNAIYRQTLESLEGTGTGAPSDDAIAAIEDAKSQIKQVLNSYRIAIASDPTDMDARANGELAWQMLKQLNQMQEQIEEQQQQQQQDDEQKREQDEESANQQQENQEQKDDGSSEEDQQKQGGEQSEEGDESKEQQQQKGEQQQNQQQDGEQSNQKQQQNQQQQDGEQSKQEQQQNQQQQDGEQSNQEQQQDQQQLDGELESTDEEMNEMKAPSTSLKDEGERLSEDEANRLLQLIRDKEQQRRKAIAARRAANRVPVGKDW